MKTAKVLYLLLCFGVICIFFYFYCYSRSSQEDSTSGVAEIWPGYQTIKAYFNIHQRGWDINNCASVPRFNNDTFTNNNFWQTTWNSKIYLYSAFIDSRIKYHGRSASYIRILAMSEGVNTDSFYCQLWYHNKSAFVVNVEQNEIWVKNWDFANSSQYYRPYLFSCPVPNEPSELPTSVALVSQQCENPSNMMKLVHLSPPTEDTIKDFVVCLKALDIDKDISLRFLEWAEFQFLLGADKVAAYVYNVHPNLTKVLDYYRQLGKLSIKNHTLPGRDPNDPPHRKAFLNKNVWQKRRHEVIQYNDCLYEHLNSHRFVVILDLDEAIVPMMHTNWIDLLEHVFSDHIDALRKYSSLSATNVYFFDEFGDHSEDKGIPPYMHMLRHVYRSANFSTPGFAVKSFHSTNNTLAVFNHYTLIPLYSELQRNALIGKHLAQLHHYRETCPPLMEKDCRTNFLKFYKKDTTMWRFKDKLITNVRKIARELNLLN